MVDAPSLATLNPFSTLDLGGKMGTMGSVLLVFVIAIVILGLIGGIIFMTSLKKKYWIKIPLYKTVGNTPTRIATYCAREIPIGLAGDKLWRVAPDKLFAKAFKIVKWLPVGRFQSAPSEFSYYLREDGEWINFANTNIDAESRKMQVKFVHEDMKLQRLATERLLEQRLMNKTFWERWGTVIMTFVFFLVIAICMVIIFFQWGKLIDKMSPMVDALTQSLKILEKQCGSTILNVSSSGTGLIPA